MSENFKLNQDGTVERDNDITMVSNTVDSEVSTELDLTGKWSPYGKQEQFPFLDNVHLRYNRFNPKKNYLLGDKNESDAQDEITYMHWVHNFLIENINDKHEAISTSVDFEDGINFTTELIMYDNRVKVIKQIRKEINEALSATCMLYTPDRLQTNLLEVPVFRHLMFTNNIAKKCLYTSRGESNCDFTYNSFKGNDLIWLTKCFNKLRVIHYKNMVENLITGDHFKLELKTKYPVFCRVIFNREI